MIKKITLLFFFTILATFGFATHNRAGYIEYSVVPNTNCMTYNFTLITYTKTSSPANASRDTLPISWGDNTFSVVHRISATQLGSNYPDVQFNIYKGTHTFPGPATYTVSCLDPNRNGGVINIPNSIDVPFFIETSLTISSYTGCDNSPVILNPPIDKGCMGVPFYYTPNAYDPDGDSLSYVLVPCRGIGGANIPGFTFPTASNTFNLDAHTGLLTWDHPTAAGEYNVAMLIKEWRNGINIGEVTLDMQILINSCNNQPPYINPLPPLCVLAGDAVHYTVVAGDHDQDGVYLYASGGPLTYEPGTCTFNHQGVYGSPTVTGYLDWATTCNDVRKQSYQFTFTANDDDEGNIFDYPPTVLTAMEIVDVTVIAPAPKNPAAIATGNNILVTWNLSPCTQAIGYKVYRKNGVFNGTIPCPCTTGVPLSTGFSLIATVNGLDTTTFLDNNSGLGLSHGIDYCYMITAIFADGSESCASVQACAELKKDSPIITNVSVVTTDAVNGAMYVAWSAPTQLDTSQYRGPYVYKIYRSNDYNGVNMNYVASTPSSSNLNDTIFNDNILINGSFNTEDNPWSYRIDLYSNDTLVDKSQIASSVYLKLSPTNHTINLSWNKNVPWLDTAFDVYRLNHFTGNWDLINHTTGNTYSNPGLANDTVYCYYVRSEGYYSQPGFVTPDTNLSERKCASAIDNVYPCAPNLTINASCTAHVDSLIWNNPNFTCASGVIEYKVYIDTNYSADTSTFKLLATINNLSDTTFIYNNPYSIAGCFKVTALDTILNETQIANTVCADNCPDYTLPNVFTPNGDGLNDFFHPFPYSFVKDIDIEIFDRWGIKMFSTTNPDINWDGTNQSTKGKCPDGVYYYICKVHAIHYNGIKTFTLKGDIELIREKK